MNDCPHYDYGKSADTALGAYCTLRKTCVEPDECSRCKVTIEVKNLGNGYSDILRSFHQEEEQRFIEKNIAK